jgi:putative nucleotidyltransferase with HDIG domain
MGALPNRAELIAAEADDIPTLPEVAWKVLRTVSENGSAEALDYLIISDQALTTRILRIANSTLFSSQQSITTISQAQGVLGFRRLRSLVLAASIDGVVRSRALKNRHIWEHALAVGLASSLLARKCNYPDPEQAFVCGLMHDVGKVVLDGGIGGEYQSVLDLVYNESLSFLEAERIILGFDHTVVGGLVARKWNLPPLVEEVARTHHCPGEAVLDKQLCALVSLADGLCVKQGIGPSKRPGLDLSTLPARQILGIEPESVKEIAVAVTERLHEDKKLFGLC